MVFLPIPSNFQDFAASQLLGAVWNWCLYGALVVQFYVYSYNFPQDHKYIKSLVYSIFLLETVQTALSGADLYYWFAAGFGNFDHLVSPFASFVDLPIMGSVVSLSVQLFFVYRIRILSGKRSRWLCVIICQLSIVGALGAFTTGIYSYISKSFMEGMGLLIFEVIWLVGNTLSDILIASTMIYHLRRIWAENDYLSNHVLVRIMRLTVETNLVTTTVSIVSLLMIAMYPDKNWYVCPTYLLGKLYSNTLLVSLNNRISFRDAYCTPGEGVVDLRTMPFPINGDSSEVTIL